MRNSLCSHFPFGSPHSLSSLSANAIPITSPDFLRTRIAVVASFFLRGGIFVAGEIS
jgi:hypothetical protein